VQHITSQSPNTGKVNNHSIIQKRLVFTRVTAGGCYLLSFRAT
jgi:hypothetical protein